VLFPVVFPGTS